MTRREKDTPLPRPTYTGWCNPSHPLGSWQHDRCRGGSDANPTKTWHPCPCDCHTQETPVTQPDPTPAPVDAAPPTPEADPDALSAAVSSIAAAVLGLNTAMRGPNVEALDVLDTLHLLRRLRHEVETLQRLDATLVKHAYVRGEHGRQLIDGVGQVYIGRARAGERWESEAGVREYVERKLIEVGGELVDPEVIVGWVLEVLPATSSTKLRTTPLKAVGIDVEDYRSSVPGKLRVDLPKAT